MNNKNLIINEITPKRSVALILLALAAVLWSLGGILIKLVSLNPVAIAGMRSLIAACEILIFIKKPDLKFTPLKFVSSFAYAATVISFVCATKLTTAANAIILQYTAPIYVAIFGAIILKEKVRWYDILTTGLILCGMVLFFLDKLSPGGMLGNIVAVFSGLAFAFSTLLLRLQKDDSPLDRIFWGNIFTAVVAVPFMFEKMPDFKSWLGLILLGVFQLGFSYMIFSVAIKNASALEAVLIPMIEPVLNPIWVAIFLNEVPGFLSLVGGLIVIFSVTARCIYISLQARNQLPVSTKKEIQKEE